jgi:hypothetical protein
MTLTRVLAVLATFLALLAPAPTRAQAEFPLCDLYTPAVASRLLGRPVTFSESDSGQDHPYWTCIHHADNANSSIAVNQFPNADDLRKSVLEQSHDSGTTPVPNIGDAALLQVCGDCTDQVRLAVARGPYLIELSLNTFPDPASADVNALVAAIKPVLDVIDNPSTRPLTAPTPTTTPRTAEPTVGCGDPAATVSAIAAHLNLPAEKITLDGGCHDVTISSNLSGDRLTSVPAAQAICESAAEIAYTGGSILSITVLSGTNEELAIGVKGQDCIGEL